MIAIYKITSLSGKIYIGQSINIEKRWKKYKSTKFKHHPKLHAAYLKYGDTFVFEIVQECSIEELNYLERHWQEYFDTVNNGLNCYLTETNNQRKVISEETKNKIRNTLTGVKHTEERKRNQSKALKPSISNETRKKMSDNRKKYYENIENRKKTSENNPNKKSVRQFDMYSKFIKDWSSASTAGRTLNICPSSITKCCKNKVKSAGQFKWTY